MNTNVTVNLSHHKKEELCTTRPAYRQGRKMTSVKVYTVNKESQHLLVYNVPAINIDSELLTLCQRYGTVKSCSRIPSQDVEDFTHVYHVAFEKVYQARRAKRKMDELSFFGGVFHVCYAPELESVEETKEKLSIRRKEVAFHLRKLEFPKQFRTTIPKKRGVKRKFQESIDSQRTVSVNNYDQSWTNQIVVPKTGSVLPGPSILQLNSSPSIDVKPFKKLIPTQIPRIIFHKREDIAKT